MLYVRSSNGQLVPLECGRQADASVGPLTINHLGQLPAVTISFNLRPAFRLGDAVDAGRVRPRSCNAAGDRQHQLPGHRASVPVFDSAGWDCC